MSNGARSTTATQTRLLVQGRLLRGLVHDLSNPLQTLISTFSLIREELHNPENALADLEIAQPELARMKELLLAARRLYNPPEKFTAAELLKDLQALARKEFQWRSLAWRLESADNTTLKATLTCGTALVAALGVLQQIAEVAPPMHTLSIKAKRHNGALFLALCPDFRLPKIDWSPFQNLLAECGGKLQTVQSARLQCVLLRFPVG